MNKKSKKSLTPTTGEPTPPPSADGGGTTACLKALIAFSAGLHEAHFYEALDARAAEVGFAPGTAWTLDGRWRKGQTAERRHRGKTTYKGEWRHSRSGVRYPTATLHNYAGHRSVFYDGFPDVVALFKAGQITVIPAARRVLPPPPPACDPQEARRRILTTYAAAAPLGSPAGHLGRVYLRSRGLTALVDRGDLPELRLHPRLVYWHRTGAGRLLRLGEFPALLGLVRDVAGAVVGLHRTYLAPDGNGKALVEDPDAPGHALGAKKLLAVAEGATQGGAIRLYPGGPCLAVTEGIETALAVRTEAPLPVWAALSAAGLSALTLPEGVAGEALYVMGDRDSSGAGQRAAETLGRRMLQPGRVVKVVIPGGEALAEFRRRTGRSGDSADWLDILTMGRHWHG